MNQIIVLANAIKAQNQQQTQTQQQTPIPPIEIKEEAAYLCGEHWSGLRLDVKKCNLQRRGVKHR